MSAYGGASHIPSNDVHGCGAVVIGPLKQNDGIGCWVARNGHSLPCADTELRNQEMKLRYGASPDGSYYQRARGIGGAGRQYRWPVRELGDSVKPDLPPESCAADPEALRGRSVLPFGLDKGFPNPIDFECLALARRCGGGCLMDRAVDLPA